jgi:hypothetical protein
VSLNPSDKQCEALSPAVGSSGDDDVRNVHKVHDVHNVHKPDDANGTEEKSHELEKIEED